ncbi:MAG TPA: pantoate--beta-alanine ligase [Abditibacteriaceae bacterium]|jgi:pantoate--beta-alanine ligase
MQIIQSPQEMQALSKNWGCGGLQIGFVPTMGALHEGHLALARRARSECDKFVASIFVNPTQFAPHEDLGRYPRPFEHDCEALREAGCDVIFAPTPRDIYGDEFAQGKASPASTHFHSAHTYVEVSRLGEVWEGTVRPGHLRGVATVVSILFNIVRPSRAYFGEKDYQQLKVVQRLVRDLHFGIEIVPCDTVREPDGLAMSSRNAYLAPDEREAACALYQALRTGAQMAHDGEHDVAKLGVAMQQICEAHPLVSLQYIAAVDAETLASLGQLDGRAARILIAARVGSTRLIDNIAI